MDGLQSGGVFWTDANGRQMLKRKRNDAGKFFEGTEPVAANVYPVNSRILLQDGSVQMAILTDRSQGGTSMRDGQIELMVGWLRGQNHQVFFCWIAMLMIHILFLFIPQPASYIQFLFPIFI